MKFLFLLSVGGDVVQPGRCGAAQRPCWPQRGTGMHRARERGGRPAAAALLMPPAAQTCTAHHQSKHTVLLGLELMVGYSGNGSMAVLVPLAHSRP